MNVAALRQQFPVLNQNYNGQTPIFFDGPGGSQVPQTVLEAMNAYLGFYNSLFLFTYFIFSLSSK